MTVWGRCFSMLVRYLARGMGHAAVVVLMFLGDPIVVDSAHAQPNEHTGAAEALFREAISLAKAERYGEAIMKFEASYELDPARGTLLGLAMAEERAGKVAAALAHYLLLRDLARQARDQSREHAARRSVDRLLPRVPTLIITAGGQLPEGTRVTLDGRELPRGALGSRLPLEPGAHNLRASAPDGSRFQLEVLLPEGARKAVAIQLSGAQPRRNTGGGFELTPLRTTGIALGAVGLAGIGVGAYYWIRSGKTYDEVNAACQDRRCPPEQRAAIDDGRNQENLARVGLIFGGLALATGLGLALADWPETPAGAHLSLSAGPGALRIRGRF